MFLTNKILLHSPLLLPQMSAETVLLGASNLKSSITCSDLRNLHNDHALSGYRPRCNPDSPLLLDILDSPVPHQDLLEEEDAYK